MEFFPRIAFDQRDAMTHCIWPKSPAMSMPARSPSSSWTRRSGTCLIISLRPATSPSCHCRRNRQSLMLSKTSGTSCAKTASQTGSSNLTTTSSITAAMPRCIPTVQQQEHPGTVLLLRCDNCLFPSRGSPCNRCKSSLHRIHVGSGNRAFIIGCRPIVHGCWTCWANG